jgi:hypothetical protein
VNSARNEGRARVDDAGADGTQIRSKVDFQIEIVPADGTSAANWGSGDFGTSPFLGQLTDKTLLGRTWPHGVPDVKNNRGR